MLIPYSTEVLIKKWPISNLVIIGICVVVFVLLLAGCIPEGVLSVMILTGWNPMGLVGYQFLHAGLLHLVFNMLYLWVFGNAVCQTVGNVAYAVLFLVTGVLAGAAHILLAGAPAIGASGAINGIIGFYLVVYPVNRVNCFYWFFRFGTFDIAGFWLILFWFLADACSAFMGVNAGIAYWAHVGGFASGFALGVLFLETGMARMAHYDNPTLLDYLRGKHKAQQGLAFEKQSFRRPPKSRQEPSLPPPSRRPPHPLPPPEKTAKVSPDINLDCPHCGQSLEVPEELIGSAFQCPSCNGEIELED
jgi:membrane associated rhomboid family serine protease